MAQHIEISNLINANGHLFFIETVFGNVWNYKKDIDEVVYTTTTWWIKTRSKEDPRQCVISSSRHYDICSAKKEHKAQIDLLYYMIENEKSFANSTITL